MSSKKSNFFPLKLNLNEVTTDPLEYSSNSQSGELKAALQDLIGSEPYEVHLSCEKVGNAYLLKGDIQTGLPLECSDCGAPFVHPVKHHFEDILVVNEAYKRGDHASKNNHAHEWEEGQPECTYLESPFLDLGELLHEELALQEPIRPEGSTDPKHTCEDLSQIKRKWLSLGKDGGSFDEQIRKSPFEALKDIKLKS
ncbi:MAG TPA: hypothetical protein DCL41_05790 [Bdellovibrionales bacterium]|nr:hypothetical protein [Bdellovibrionales bacterium]